MGWVVAERKLLRKLLEGMWEWLGWLGKGARVQQLEEKGLQIAIKYGNLNRRTVVGVTRALAGLADAMLLREKGWHAWRSGGLTLFLP